MNLKNIVAATGLIAVLGAAGVAGSVVAQDRGSVVEGGMMQEMNHGRMMEGMGHGGTTGDKQAQSQGGRGAHGAHGAAAPAMPCSPATEAFRAANLAMHAAMDIEFSDNADIDFARGMIGHHQGAIDMARIMLEHGEDPELRRLAEEVIEAQEAEIAFLQNWISEHAE